MSLSNLILEGLRESKNKTLLNESSFEDTPVCSKPRELQRILSDAFKKKYIKVLNSVGIEDMGVEVYTHEDDESRVEDAIYEITLYISLKGKTDIKVVKPVIDRELRKYPKFSYDKTSNQFYCTLEEYADIIDVVSTLELDGAVIKKLYNIESAGDIEDRYNSELSSWDSERGEQIRSYNKSKL